MENQTLPIEEHNRQMKNMRSLWEITADRADLLQKQRDAFMLETLTLTDVLADIQNALSKLNHKQKTDEHTESKCTTDRLDLDRGRVEERNIYSSIEPEG